MLSLSLLLAGASLAGTLALPLLLGALFWMVSTGAIPSFWIAPTAVLAGSGGILARMFYRMYLWSGPEVRSRPAEVVALQRRRVIHNSPHAPGSYWVYQAVLRPLDQAKGGKQAAPREVVVPVFSEWDCKPVERGGENCVTHYTLHCGEVVPLYSNQRGEWSLTRYSRRSLAQYYLKCLAGWTVAWGAVLLALVGP